MWPSAAATFATIPYTNLKALLAAGGGRVSQMYSYYKTALKGKLPAGFIQSTKHLLLNNII